MQAAPAAAPAAATETAGEGLAQLMLHVSEILAAQIGGAKDTVAAQGDGKGQQPGRADAHYPESDGADQGEAQPTQQQPTVERTASASSGGNKKPKAGY
eukprot:Skav234443  [mRNA]  locus=scaffold1647:29513:30666:+ [translate_table: standard]